MLVFHSVRTLYFHTQGGSGGIFGMSQIFTFIYTLITRILRAFRPGHVLARLTYEKQGPEDAAEADQSLGKTCHHHQHLHTNDGGLQNHPAQLHKVW